MEGIEFLKQRLAEQGIELEDNGTSFTRTATLPNKKNIQIVFRQREISESGRFRFHVPPSAYSKSMKVFIICHDIPSGRMWIIPKKFWRTICTESGYCDLDRISEHAFRYQNCFELLKI